MSRRERMRRRRRSRAGQVRRTFAFTLGLLTVSLVIAGLAAVGYVISIAESAPDIRTLKPADAGEVSVVYAADGTKLGYIQNDQLRKEIHSGQIPRRMKEATVAIEDRRFYEHKGVDYEGVIRAAVKNLESGNTVQGGSTLTMQLVRNLYTGDRERDYKRKIREAKLAEELENLHPGRRGKAWILNKYINNVPYGTVGGQEAIGVQAAARVFFDKPARDLTLREAALLAGLPQAPTTYNPFLHPERAMARRNDVLDRMAEQGYISVARAEREKRKSLGVRSNEYYTKRREQYFFDYVRSELIRKYGRDRVRRGGLRVYTTVSLDMQKKARKAIAGRLNQPGDPASAIVTINPRNGHILAMASSASYAKSKFNLAAQGHRQPGSTFKIMGLMAALRRGADPKSTYYTSKPLAINDPKYGPIRTKTYSNTYGGSMNLVTATLKSDNSVYQQLALDVGPNSVRQTAYDMGIRTKLDGYPAEVLGGLTKGVTPLEMTSAYSTIANGGFRIRPTAIKKVQFPDGKVDSFEKPRKRKAFKDGVTQEVVRILEKNVTSGTGRAALPQECPVAGKTGTTDTFKDAWFVGFSPRYATAVWVGYPNAAIPMLSVHGRQVNGGSFPTEIWGDYMRAVTSGKPCGEFDRTPKQPADWSPFFGKYASTGRRSDDSYDYGTNGGGTNGGGTGGTGSPDRSDGGGTNGGGTGGGGNDNPRYPSDLYETPPQKPPKTGNGNGNR